MAKYPSISQTKNGRILIAKSNATGKALVPIKVVAGDGRLTNQNIETMENLINPLLELPFASPGRFIKDGQFQLDFALSNKNLEHGFRAREVGIFAKLDGEDDSMAVMIAYTNGDDYGAYIPAKDTPINSKVFEVTITVDNAASVVVQRSDAAYITAGEMERHNADANAHDIRFNAIIQQVNNMITSVDNAEGQPKAPTLELVKNLQKGYLPITGGDLKGEITVNGKATKSIVDSWYSSDKSQYWIKYSDGELVQMLTKDNPGLTGIIFTTINLFQPFVDTNYFVNAVYETHSQRKPNQNTSLSNSITAIDNTVTDSNSVPKSKNKFTISIDSMSLCRVYCVGRWKE